MVANRERLGIEMVPDTPEVLDMGGICGMVDIVNMTRNPLWSKWMFGPEGWILKDPVTLPLYKCRGYPGLFDVKEPRRIDTEGRDITILPGLWDESDRFVWN